LLFGSPGALQDHIDGNRRRETEPKSGNQAGRQGTPAAIARQQNLAGRLKIVRWLLVSSFARRADQTLSASGNSGSGSSRVART